MGGGQGPNGGHTDLVSNGTYQSAYVLVRNVGGTNYLVVRMRLGGASTASKGYSVLFDTDGVFGNYPTSSTPGYEKEMVLEGGNSGRVAIYTHSASGTVTSFTYDINVYSQRSVALSTSNNDPDYFYDFFVPLNDLGLTSTVRMTASALLNAGTALGSNVSDVNGVNDLTYAHNQLAMMTATISSFPSTNISNMTAGASFGSVLSFTPTINGSITTTTTQITGTSQDDNGTTITVYKNGSSLGTTTVTSNSWTFSSLGSLTAGDIITVKATATGKAESLAGGNITVVSGSCYLARPSITSRANGSQQLTGTWPGTPPANRIRIRFYYQSSTVSTLTEDAATSSVYVTTGGTWTFSGLAGASQSTFNPRTYYVIAIDSVTGCTSQYSEPTLGNSGTVTTAPSITTSSVLDSVGPRIITVQNLHNGNATITLYVNGVSKETSAAIALNATTNFSVSGLNAGDTIFARAQASATSTFFSGLSNKLVVSSRAGATSAPFISGAYTSGSGKTVSGTSTETPGTTIYLFKASTTSLGTTTVNSYGIWSVSGLTLAGGDVLTARALAVGKTISSASSSVTVSSTTPATPGGLPSGITVYTTSVSGTLSGVTAGDTVRMYVDGALVASVVASTNWTISGLSSNILYRGGQVTFAVTNSTGASGALSSAITITGVVSFKITNTSDGTLGNQVAGTPFNIKISAMDGANGSGNVVTAFTGTVSIYSTSKVLNGIGTSATFVAGVLSSHSMTLSAAGTGITIGCLNTEDPSALGSTTINVSAAIFDGSSGTDYSTAANWLNNTVPASGADILLDASNTANDLILTSNLTFGSVTISQANHQIITNGNTLTLTGSISVSNGGEITATSGTVVMSGTSAQTIPADAFTSDAVENLTINNTFGVSLSGPLNISGVFTPTAGTFTTNGNLNFTSSSATSYGQISGTGSGTISGNVTMNKMIGNNSQAGWRHVSFPVTGTLAGFNGILIKSTSHPTSNERNVYSWNSRLNGATDAFGWTQSASTGTQDSAYAIYGANNTLHDISANWSMTGAPNTGDKTFNLFFSYDPGFSTPESRGWNLIPNPYPSNLDVSVLLASSEFNSITYKAAHVWDMNSSQYRAITASSVTNWHTNTTALATTTDLSIFQGFWVKVNSNTSLTLKNTHRTTTLTAGSFLKKEFDLARLNVKTPSNMEAQIVVYFADDATDNLDQGLDAYFLRSMVAGAPQLYNLSSDGKLSINAYNLAEGQHSVPVGYQSTENGLTTLAPDFSALDSKWTVTLEDKVTGKTHDLRASAYTFQHNGNSDSRFIIHFNSTPNFIDEVKSGSFRLFQNADGVFLDAGANSETIEVAIYDITGRLILQNSGQYKGIEELSLGSNLPSLYIVKAKLGEEVQTIKVIR